MYQEKCTIRWKTFSSQFSLTFYPDLAYFVSWMDMYEGTLKYRLHLADNWRNYVCI